MATVIDHIIVELELDPKKFDTAVKKHAETWLRMREATERHAKEMGGPLEGMKDAFSGLIGKVVAFGASLLTVQKLISFGVNIVRTNLDLGTLSKTTGISVETISKWGFVAERAGSSVQSMNTAIAGMDRELKQMRIDPSAGQNLLSLIDAVNKAGGNIPDPLQNRAIKGDEMWLKINEEMERIGMDKGRRQAFLQRLGYADPSIVALFTSGMDKFKKMVEEQKGISVVTQQNIDVAEELNTKWKELEERTRSLGEVILHDFAGPIKSAIDAAQTLVKTAQNPPPVPTPPKDFKDQQGWREFGRNIDKWLGTTQPPPEFWDKFKTPGAKAAPAAPGAVTTPQSFRGTGSFYRGGANEGGPLTSTGERVIPESYTGALQTDIAKGLGGINAKTGGRWGDVIDEKTGKRVRVYFNDTGPLAKDRIVDLAPKAFREFAPENQGLAPNLRLEMLPPAPKDKPYFGGPVPEGDASLPKGATPQSYSPPPAWMSNPRLLRAPRFNTQLTPGSNFSSSETTIHSLVVNSAQKPITDDAWGLGVDAIPSLERGAFMNQMTEGPF